MKKLTEQELATYREKYNRNNGWGIEEEKEDKFEVKVRVGEGFIEITKMKV